MKNVIHIFYKDLNFHHALVSLSKAYRILPVFLWSEYLNQGIDTSPSIDYRFAWARAFNNKLLPTNVNMPQVVDVESIIRLAKVYNIKTISMLKYYEPREVMFQTELKKRLDEENIELILSDGFTASPLGRKFWHLENNDFTLTAYQRAWYENYKECELSVCDIEWLEVDFGNDYNVYRKSPQLKTDLNYLAQFQSQALVACDCNALSTALSHGIVSAYSLLNTQCSVQNRCILLDLLSKRDYAYERLYYYAGTERQLYGNVMDIKWQNNVFDYHVWCQGQTKDSSVNDAMQRLYRTGIISEDEQKYVAAYLTKTLKVSWREGVRWFREHLVSFDLAQCIYLWQGVLLLDK